MMQAQTLKGFRDFLPEDAIQRQTLITTIREVFERFGFDPLETPALEYAETLMGKYGDESDKLLYLFEDHGGRKVGMRYDQTVPLARVIAQYPDLPLPFKRYQIQPVWRAENTQKGRFREFLQCDIDTVGTESPLSDAEIIATVLTVAKTLGLPQPIVHINDRTIFDELGFTKKEIIIIDKLDKIGRDAVMEELGKLGGSGKLGTFEQLAAHPKTNRLEEITKALKDQQYEEGTDFRFDPFLARGLEYYTSTIFELKIPAYGAGSLAGGGRYDNLIGMFSGRNLPAVGIAFGFDRMVDAMKDLGLATARKTNALVLVTIFSPEMLPHSLALSRQLRTVGIPTEITFDINAKLEKQLKYADKKGIPFVIIQGPEERNKHVVKLKDMKTQEQKEMTTEEAIKVLRIMY